MFYMQIPFFSLDKTFNSGQNLLWKKICDGKYIITYRDKIVQVEQNRDRFCFSCSQDNFYNVWFDYFDLGTDYMDLFYNFASIDKEYIKPICVRGQGVHIIKQDDYECKLINLFKELIGPGFYEMFLGLFGKKKTNTIMSKHIKWVENPCAEKVLGNVKKLDKHFGVIEGLVESIINVYNGYSSDDIAEYIDCGLYSNIVKICSDHNLSIFLIDKDIKQYIDENFFLTPKEFYDIFILDSHNYEFLEQNIAFLSYLMKYDYNKQNGVK